MSTQCVTPLKAQRFRSLEYPIRFDSSVLLDSNLALDLYSTGELLTWYSMCE